MNKFTCGLIFLLPISMANVFFCEVIDSAKASAIASTPLKDYQACFKALSFAPTSPKFGQNFFQQFDGKESIVMGCMTSDKGNMTYAFLNEDGIKSIRVPIYYYDHKWPTGEIEKMSYPRNVTRAKYQGKDLWVFDKIGGVVVALPWEKVPAFYSTVTPANPNNLKKEVAIYDAWLKEQGKLEKLNLVPTPEEDMPAILACLEHQKQKNLTDYLTSKYRPSMVMLGTLESHLKKGVNGLSDEEKALYKVPWETIKAGFLTDLPGSHPDCEGLVSKEEMEKIFDRSWGKNKQVYDYFHNWYWEK